MRASVVWTHVWRHTSTHTRVTFLESTNLKKVAGCCYESVFTK